MIAREIKLRRHETSNLIKELQTKMIKALFDCKSIEEVYTIGYSRALKIIEETIKNMTENKIPEKDLILSKTLRKPIQEYKSTPPTRCSSNTDNWKRRKSEYRRYNKIRVHRQRPP
ncbi:MAG: DNA polymerase domain-containing protein [Nitrososphaeria archaeon]